jgi:glycosyltransferase involved in cell wall biosynthesis
VHRRNSGPNRGNEHPLVLIGFLSRKNPGAIPTITREFIEGLRSRYRFVPFYAERERGQDHLGEPRLINLYYLVRHFTRWLLLLLRYRPSIAHYPITSYWNLEKSLLFLGTARLLGCRTVGHLHGGAFIDFWSSLPRWRKAAAMKSFARLNAFVVLSEGWRDAVQSKVGVGAERLHVVHNLLDRGFEEALLELPAGREGKRLFSLGVMSRTKGVLDLIEGFAGVQDRNGYTLLLVGPERDPGITADCSAAIARCGLERSVELRPAVWGDDRVSLFRDATVFVLPSYFENFPLSVFEAAAAALPIVTCAVGAVPEFFSHGESALFVEPGNIREISDALSRLIGDAGLRRQLGERAREVFVRRLSRSAILDSLDSVYRNVLVNN